MKLRTGFIAWVALATFAAAAENLPCEPGAACAMQMTRDQAMKELTRPGENDSIIYAISLLEWAQRVDPEPEAAARARHAPIAARIKRISDAKEKALAGKWLAGLMITSGFFDEARKSADTLAADMRENVYSGMAHEYARRGHWREAIKVANALREDGPRFTALFEALKSVANTGQPQLIEEAASLLKDPIPLFVPIGLAFADLAAGRDDAALQRARQQRDADSRLSLLSALSSWYRDKKRDIEELRLERAQLEEIRALDQKEWFAQLSKSYFDGLVRAGQYSQALAWAPELPADDRDLKMFSLLYYLRQPADIAAASKLLGLVSEDSRERAREALTWARIASGAVEPSAGIKSVANPDSFARHVVELLTRDSGVERTELGREIVAAVQAAVTQPASSPLMDDYFFHLALARAQIRFGLLEDARATIDVTRDPQSRAETLLLLSAAQSRAGQIELARATRSEAMALLARKEDPLQPDFRAAALLKADMLDDAEAELRRLMASGPKPPPLSRVAEPLIGAYVKRGDVKRAFQLAVDWSALHDGDPEALANLYRDLTKSKDPPPNLWPVLKGLHKFSRTP